jgi:ATP-dependent helicase/DNAse subunit B
VLALLKSGYLPIDPDSANRIEMEARKRGIFRGREEWLRDFSPEGGRQLNADGDHPSTFSVARDEEAEANRQKNEALSLIVKVEEDLGKHPTPAAFRAGILGWLKDEVVQRRLATADAEMVRMDGLALLQIDELLREMEEAMGPDAGGLALKDLAKRLRLAIEAAWVECAAEQKGVLCLDVEQARHFEAEVVFVLGLNERFFPRPAQQEPFYADWERGDVRHLGGLGLQTSPWEAERERLLFYSAVTRARRNLYLCRPNTDNEGKELLESFFLYELKHLFSPESVKDQTRRRLIHEVVVEDPLTEREALNLAVVTGLEEGKELGLEGQASENLRTQIAEAARVAKRKTETQLAAGEFEAPEVISITSLETYASCPFKFYAQQILQLKPSEEIGPLERGQLLHKVLSRLLTKEKDWREERKDNLVVKARGILDEEVKTSGYGRRDEKGYRLGLLREGVLQLLDEFVAQELKLRFMLPEFRPACFELSFGYRASSTSEAFDDKGSPEGKQKASGIKPLPTVEPLIIGGSILLQGRIDRVDLEEGSKNCVMFDYKSGSREFNADEMGQGTSLQLPLYLLAMTDIWHLKPLAGLFYTKEGPSSGIVWREMEGRLGFRSAPKKRMVVSDLEEVRKRVAPVVEELVGRIKQGVFPATPGERCRWCSFPSLCRQERLRQ